MHGKLLRAIQHSLFDKSIGAEWDDEDEKVPLGWIDDDDDDDEVGHEGLRSDRLRIVTADYEEDRQSTVSLKSLKARIAITPLPIKMQLQTALYGAWCAYNPLDEFQRMGVPNEQWRLTDVNTAYQLCSTYPQQLAVAATADDALITASASFRSKARFPTLSWRDPISNCKKV